MNKHKPNISLKLKLLVIAPLLLLFGVALYGFIISTPDFIRGYQIRSSDATTVGTVVEKTSNAAKYANKAVRNSEKLYDTATVKYVVRGKEYSASHTVYTPLPGETVILFYDPQNPQDTITEVEVLFAKYYWMPRAVISALGIILIPTLLYLRFKQKK